jgi:hypothetical protein
VIAPILLPILSLLTLLISSPAPILEWNLVPLGEGQYILQLHVLASSEADVCKLSLVPSTVGDELDLVASPLRCDDHWTRNAALHWMWNDVPSEIALDVNVHLSENAVEPGSPLLDVRWEQVHQGQRHSWTLGTLAAPEAPKVAVAQNPKVAGLRKALPSSPSTCEVILEVQNAQPESFVKWTEYIPQGCVCEVIDAAGASLRSLENRQMFLWFQVGDPQELTPKYRLTCAEKLHELDFYGELESAFGTATISSHIAGVEWVGDSPDSNENMKLNQSPDAQSVASCYATAPLAEAGSSGTSEVRFSVQLLANHRDMDASEVADVLGFVDSYHIYRHEGWHKYLTDDVMTYGDARLKRSTILKTTAASDAFVTASLEGERITVQEALLLSNQTWNP